MQRFYAGQAIPRPPQALRRRGQTRPPAARAKRNAAAAAFGASYGAQSPSAPGDDRDAVGFKHWRSTRNTGRA
jgi:hypothetical protein